MALRDELERRGIRVVEQPEGASMMFFLKGEALRALRKQMGTLDEDEEQNEPQREE